MNKKIYNDKIVVIESETQLITDLQSALDFILSVSYETNCNCVALNKGAIIDEFFILSTGIAGEILQKFITYNMKFAIYGDFSHYKSKPLHDFIYESNKGNHVYFVSNVDEAIEKLNQTNV